MQVVFTPEAEDQIAELYEYIAREASHEIALRYVEGLVSYCESLIVFPLRGLLREDVRPGLRVTHFRGRTAIAFAVQQVRIEILGIFHGGQDYVRRLR